MREKRMISLLLAGSLLLSLAGCAGRTEGSSAPEEKIELLEPVSAEMSFELAQPRNLYIATTYSATVVPYVEEYAPQNAMQFGYYDVYPGETVKKGQQIVVSDTEKADEQIKAKREAIEKMEEEYLKYVEAQKKSIAQYREEENGWKVYVDLNEAQEPPATVQVPSKEDPDKMVEVENPEHATWQTGYNMVNGKYRIAKHAADTIEMQMEQRKAIYELDLKHEQYLLKELQNQRRLATVESEMDGTLVAVKEITWNNSYLDTTHPVAAVADLSQKRIRCEYINQGVIKKAADVYAVIDGKRYEVEYQPISAEEYQELSAGGNKVYSTFLLKDAGEEINVGDYAVISVITDRREDALSVSKGAIQKDESGNYVYVIKDGQSVYTSVRTGLSDGNFTEILQGLEAGDKVVYSGGETPGNETTVLELGEFNTAFSNRARMEYPSSNYLKNPVENGTVYYGEAKVRLYQHVEKGDVIATVRVEPDNIALARNEKKLARLKERLADYLSENKEHQEEEYYIEEVKRYREQIEELEKDITKQKTDFATTEIKADCSGVIVEMREYNAEDIVQRNENVVRIANDETCYVLVEDKNQILQFGNQVSVGYMNDKMEMCAADGTVVSMTKMGVSASLTSDYAYILLPKDKIGDMMNTPGFGDGYWNRDQYFVSGLVRNMENVVVVPRKAVFEMNGKTYVYVKDADGNISHRGFVPGGYNNDYYWVVEGLTEGMEVCLK